jgi:hypothetical protein
MLVEKVIERLGTTESTTLAVKRETAAKSESDQAADCLVPHTCRLTTLCGLSNQ